MNSRIFYIFEQRNILLFFNRYEAWENKQIAQKASATRIPLWNGLFCAMDPEYASKGFGSAVYQGGVSIMTKHWLRQLKRENGIEKSSHMKEKNADSIKNLMRSLSSSHVILEDCLETATDATHAVKDLIEHFETLKQKKPALKVSKCESPLVVIISHCKRSAKFHQTNGFEAISEIPFHDDVENVTPFFAQTMILDPLNTGRAKELTAGLRQNEDFELCKCFPFDAISNSV